MNKLIILLMAILIFASISGIGTAAEHAVSPGNSIQTTVNSASPGDVIIVKPGTYTENVRITTPNLVVKSESGKSQDTIIKTASARGFDVAANGVTISGFKVESGESGIRLVGCSGCSITNNDLSSNDYGIFLNISNSNKISGNTANLNSLFGIYLLSSGQNNISYNNVNSNQRGINSITSNNNQIIGNIASNNSAYGMWISQSHDNSISGNTVSESGGNNGRGGGGGIHFNSSSRNAITGNTVAFNIGSGFFECPGCHNNVVYNNYVNNTYNANINTRDTTWYLNPTSGTNIVGGPYIGGNFWGTPAGTGFSNTAQDLNKDGIADTGYSVSNITDNYPLVVGESYLPAIKPVANFNTNVTSGYAPLTVQFNDLSSNVVERNWDFGDGSNSTEQRPVNTYYSAGNYTVNLTVANQNGMNSKLVTITVLRKPVANFSVNVTKGPAPLAVQFTDLSQNAVSWSWDFNNDGVPEAIDQNPVNQYTTPGNYTVKLIVSNENGNNSTTQKIIVQDPKDLPVANFGTNVTSGYAPLAVQFTDLSQNSIGRGWDFNNDWQGDSGDAAPVYVFTEPGSYNVNLVAINENGTATKTTTIIVLEERSSGGSSSGGSGGGSPESSKNVKVKELCQVFITSGKAVKFDFTKNATAIVNLNFDAKKTVGKTTTIVEMLKNKSTLTPETPEGEVYNYLNIWVGNGGYGSDEDNLENAVINFRVEKSWVKDKGIDQSSIVLNRYNEKKWNELTTCLSGEDDKYLYFKAETAGFSPFAITSKTAEKQTDVEIKPENADDKENTGNTAADVEQQPENKENTSTAEEIPSEPGFEVIYGVAGLLAVFLHKRK